MFKTIGFLISLLAGATLFATPSEAGSRHGNAATCVQPVDNGCAAANKNGSVWNASLLFTAQRDGSNSLLPTRGGGLLQLNIPGVDYPVGPDKTLTPTDPRNFNDGVCAWDSAAGGRILCTGAGTYHEVLDNIDFCGTKVGQPPAYLFLNSGVAAGSTITVKNSYFCLQPDPGGTGQGVGVSIGFSGPASWSLTFTNNQCDGTNTSYSTTGSCISVGFDASGTTIDAEYNAFTVQNSGRVANGQTNSSLTMKYNFIQGLNDAAPDFSQGYPGNHGEVMSRNCSNTRAGCNGFSDYYEGNFIIWNPPVYAGSDNTTIFPSDGSPDAVSYSSVGIVNNVIVTNKGNGSITGPDVGIMTVNAVATLGNVTISGNWVEASGTGTGCTIIGDKSTQGAGITASQSGTVINITNTNGGMTNHPIEPGWQFWRGGVRVATITSFGTGTGQTGTYNVNTSATIGSDSAWTVVPGWTSLTQSGNYNLNDPSHTGVPQAMTISGPAMIASPCVQ